jgi:hypothetical protein
LITPLLFNQLQHHPQVSQRNRAGKADAGKTEQAKHMHASNGRTFIFCSIIMRS